GPTFPHNRLVTGVDFVRMASMPVKLCKGSVNNQVTCLAHLKAKINIGERAREAFVESSHLLKNCAAREQARGRYPAAIAGHLLFPVSPRIFSWKPEKGRLR